MFAHELAAILLKCPDQQVTLYVNYHSYHSDEERRSHGPLRVVYQERGGRSRVLIGNMPSPVFGTTYGEDA